jgi:hypothetical protein
MPERTLLLEGHLQAQYTGPELEATGTGTASPRPYARSRTHRIVVYKDAHVRDVASVDPAQWETTRSDDAWVPVEFRCQPAIYFQQPVLDGHRFLRDDVVEAFVRDPHISSVIKPGDGSFGRIAGTVRFKVVYRTPDPVVPPPAMAEPPAIVAPPVVPESAPVIASTPTVAQRGTGCLSTGLPLGLGLGALALGWPGWLAALFLLLFLLAVLFGGRRAAGTAQGCVPRLGCAGLLPLLLLLGLGVGGFRACTNLVQHTDWEGLLRNDRLRDDTDAPDWTRPDSSASDDASAPPLAPPAVRDTVLWAPDTVAVVTGGDTVRIPTPGPGKVALALYDGDRVDNDRISVVVNGQPLAADLTLARAPGIFDLPGLRMGENYIDVQAIDAGKGSCTARLVAITADRKVLDQRCYRPNGSGCRITLVLP